MPIAFGSTPITSVSRGANAIASAALERLGFPGQTASVFSAISPPDAPTNVAITVEEDYAAPSQVTGLAVDSTGDGTIDLSWTAPASEVAITDYRVEYTPSGGSAAEVLVGSDATSYQLTGLTNGTEYSVRVAAISAGGQGDYSAAVTGTPGAVPLAIVALTDPNSCSAPSANNLYAAVQGIPASATTIRFSSTGTGASNYGIGNYQSVFKDGIPIDQDIGPVQCGERVNGSWYSDGSTAPYYSGNGPMFRVGGDYGNWGEYTVTVELLDSGGNVVGSASLYYDKGDCE